MFDKIRTVNEYCRTLDHTFNDIADTCKLIRHNIIVINSNTPYTTKILQNMLSKNRLNIFIPTESDIVKYGSIGNYLRLKKQIENSVIVFDFIDLLSDLFDDRKKIDTINVNRDLFKLSNTIIISSPKLTYGLRRHACDFWNCLNIYADATKWYCSPIMPPIVNLSIEQKYEDLNKNIQPSIHLPSTNDIIQMQKNIYKQLEIYNHSIFDNLFEEISQKPFNIRQELFCLLFDALVKSKAKFAMLKYKIIDAQRFMECNEVYIKLTIKLAEFFYKTGEYALSKKCYQKLNKFVMEYLMDEDFDIVQAFISCNISICNYLEEKKHSPNELELELHNKLKLQVRNANSNTQSFVNEYLFLVNSTDRHHSYGEHRDIYEHLKNSARLTSLGKIDMSETYLLLLNWSELICSKYEDTVFHPTISKFKELDEIYYRIYEMILFFENGDFPKSEENFQIARGLARTHGYKPILEFINVFHRNITYIYNKGFE